MREINFCVQWLTKVGVDVFVVWNAICDNVDSRDGDLLKGEGGDPSVHQFTSSLAACK